MTLVTAPAEWGRAFHKRREVHAVDGPAKKRRVSAMIQLFAFAGQNWLITPAALALNEAPPRDIHDQKWLLVLSGSLYANFSGTDFDDVPDVKSGQFNPDIASPCNWATNHHGIARPPGAEGVNYNVRFQAELWAPFVSLGGFIDEDSDWAQTEADSDARLTLINYNVTLVGKIVFTQILIT